MAAHMKGKETKIKRPIRATNSFHLILNLRDFMLHIDFFLNTKSPSERNVQLAARPCLFPPESGQADSEPCNRVLIYSLLLFFTLGSNAPQLQKKPPAKRNVQLAARPCLFPPESGQADSEP
jgi:hypothetical protein